MLTKTTLERLQEFRIPGFIDALAQQMESRQYDDLTFEERLTLLIDTEHIRRLDARTKRLIRTARLSQSASLEEVDFSVKRGLKKTQFLEVCQGNWLSKGANLIVTGSTGTGKTFLSCALAHRLIMQGFPIRFNRTNLWLADLHGYLERHRLSQAIAGLRKVSLLIFDEWLLDSLSHRDSRLLLELLEYRYNRYSCAFLSQIPVSEWHSRFEDPTIADAILDRIVHNGIRIELTGDSMRKLKKPDLTKWHKEETSLRSEGLATVTEMK